MMGHVENALLKSKANPALRDLHPYIFHTGAAVVVRVGEEEKSKDPMIPALIKVLNLVSQPTCPPSYPFEMKLFRRCLHVSHIKHKTNEYVRQPVDSLAGIQQNFLTNMKRRKLSWFGLIIRHNTALLKDRVDVLVLIYLRGTIVGAQNRHFRCWFVIFS